MRTTIKFTVTDPKALHAAQPTLVEVVHVPAHDDYIPDHGRIRAALKAGVVLPGVKLADSSPATPAETPTPAGKKHTPFEHAEE